MDNELVKKTFTVDNQIEFDCWVVKIDDKFWFKGYDVAVFLDYKRPDQAIRIHVPLESRKKWRELKPPIAETISVPSNWKPHTVFITEGGLNRLICRSTKPEAIRFQKWVFDEVLPTLRQQGTYTIQSLTGQVNQLSSQLAIKNEMIVTLKEKIVDQHERLAINDRKRLIQDQKISRLEKRAAVIPVENETKHIFRLFRHQDIPNKYLFLRPQSKYLSRAMKVVDLDLYELIMDETNVPNAMNILNTLKEKLKLLNIKYTALANTLAIVVVNDDDDDYDDDMDNSSVSGTVNVPEMVSELIQESLT
jgi:prophage antirepressor-like protein